MPQAPTLTAITLAQAESGPPAGDKTTPQGGSNMMSTVGLMVVMVAIIYFLLIRPQSKERKRHQQMLDQLKKNDQVVTQGGVYGTVVALDKEAGTVSLKIADNVRIKIRRANIATVVGSEDE
jgi:preprotein translocase subunit YajC